MSTTFDKENLAQVMRKPKAFMTPEGTRVMRAEIEDRVVFFTLRDTADRIQRKHSRGRFYEPDELEIVRAHFPKGGVFCDAGSNIGNHSLFALIHLGARRAILFEPNPDACELLISNMMLNGLMQSCDMSHLGFGLSDRMADDMALALRDRNLGAARLVSGEGAISVRPGDDMLDGQRIDFLKIDVEGMEIQVLRGFEKTIAACRPPIFLELEHARQDEFTQWAADMDYGVAVEGRAFRHNRNLLALPRESLT